eukprot:6967412-Prymnesium_polylepis.1
MEARCGQKCVPTMDSPCSHFVTLRAPPPHFKAIASSPGLEVLSGCSSGLYASERSHAESFVS